MVPLFAKRPEERRMAQVDILFKEGEHEVLRFADRVVGEGVQANQFCIRHSYLKLY